MAVNHNKKWQNLVNDFLQANTNLEYWVAKREAVENNYAFNYIRFPKDVNGKKLSVGFIKYIVQIVELDKNLCDKFFGPGYKQGTAEIQDDVDDISIIWNKISMDDIISMLNDDNRSQLISLYKWNIWFE